MKSTSPAKVALFIRVKTPNTLQARRFAHRVFRSILEEKLDNSLMSNYNVRMKTDHVIVLISTIRDKANKLIDKELRSRNISGLAPSHGAILFELFRSETVSMMEIAKRINRDKSTVTALVKKLIDLGYVERVKDPNDSRVTLVELTKKGRELKPDFDEISKILLERIYKSHSTQEKEGIIRGLERLLNNL